MLPLKKRARPESLDRRDVETTMKPSKRLQTVQQLQHLQHVVKQQETLTLPSDSQGRSLFPRDSLGRSLFPSDSQGRYLLEGDTVQHEEYGIGWMKEIKAKNKSWVQVNFRGRGLTRVRGPHLTLMDRGDKPSSKIQTNMFKRYRSPSVASFAAVSDLPTPSPPPISPTLSSTRENIYRSQGGESVGGESQGEELNTQGDNWDAAMTLSNLAFSTVTTSGVQYPPNPNNACENISHANDTSFRKSPQSQCSPSLTTNYSYVSSSSGDCGSTFIPCPLCGDRVLVEEGGDEDEAIARHVQRECRENGGRRRGRGGEEPLTTSSESTRRT